MKNTHSSESTACSEVLLSSAVFLSLFIHATICLPLIFFVIVRKNPYTFTLGMAQALVTALMISSRSEPSGASVYVHIYTHIHTYLHYMHVLLFHAECVSSSCQHVCRWSLFRITGTRMNILDHWFHLWFPAPPPCQSPSDVLKRTIASTSGSPASCSLWAPPSTWTVQLFMRPWPPSSSPSWMTTTWTWDRLLPSGVFINRPLRSDPGRAGGNTPRLRKL